VTAAGPVAGPAVAGGWTDRVLDLDVGPVAHGGHCVARVENPPHPPRVVFVRHALPGERVHAVVTEDAGGGFCRADAIAVLRASPARVEPPCVWARPGGCGGCDFQHAEPGYQRELKAAVLAEQLRRLAGVERDVVVEELPGGSLGSRHRVRLAVDGEGRGGLRAHRSHDVLPIADCPLAPPGLLAPVLAGELPVGSEVEVTLDANGTVHTSSASRPLHRSESGGSPVVQRAAGREWHLSPGTFWQVHPALADTLADVVAEWAATPVGGTAWDLYGGVGLFAAVLAGQVGPDGAVHVVESSPQAVADGRAALADLPQVSFTPGRVEKLIGRLPGTTPLTGPDVVVADPPRRGLGGATVAALAARRPARIVHVACDPAALARDVGLLAGHGYALAELRAFDAFPMTHHVESVALFCRSG
jgi:tRNA/tmRNA/rRNA uracil-C5-methylase (TrmA/RlmC/RlmD family)